SEEALNAALNQWYGVGDERRQLIESLARDLKKLDREVGCRDADEAAVRNLRLKASEPELEAQVHQIIVQAVLENASDVHLEPGKDSLQVRFRIDGVLFNRFDLPSSQLQPLVARIKLMAGLDIAKKRIPQDGAVSFSMRERSVDIRVSVFPALYGENAVLSISNKSREVPDLADLGLSEENLNDFRRAIRSRKGLVLISGPADSHKTTTVYSCLKNLRSPEKKLMTIEDPVECELEGVVQGQVDLKAGFTYSEALNAMLHQDPDVIYLGEIKDFDTAGLAIRAALTGHLVLSTVHANNSFEAITQLYDMGVNPGLLESVLNCSVAQRQVRCICPNCRTEYQPLEKTLSELGLPPETPLFKGEGCQQCNDSGSKGTTGIFEVLMVSKRIRKLIASFTSEEEIMDAAWSHGMKSLFDDGLSKVVAGVTTLDELRRVLYHHLPKSPAK
ncbi:MAG: GspE/PulE family protein, partial [Thermoanaerobaculia bacterium]